MMKAGANCVWSLSEDTREMDMDELFDFLEPNEERGGAMCMSTAHWEELKTAVEQLCKKLGTKCTMETKRLIETIKRNIEKLREINEQ